MADQIFKSPGYFDRETDLSSRVVEPTGIPAVIIGTSQKGPAFVPVTLGSFSDFQTKFGDLNTKFPAPYAVQKWLENKSASTFIRVLGAGANSTQSEIDDTRTKGIVKNAGFKISGSAVSSTDKRYQGSVQFLVAKHVVTGSELYGMPMFSDNSSFFTTGSSSEVHLVRGMIMSAYDTRIMILSASETFAGTLDDIATLDNGTASQTYGKFKIAISSSVGSSFASTDGVAGVKILTASLNPSNSDYIGKILNTDPDKFETEKHLLYCDYAVDNEVATISTGSGAIAIISGSANTSATSGDTSLVLRDSFGRFDTRFTTPKTTWFISQPFGQTEHNLFYCESLDDGAFANTKYKISIANIKASADPQNEYGTFALLVRAFDDTDVEPKVIEQYNNLSLDPASDNYIAKVIGDVKISFSFDVVDPDDRRLVVDGKNPNKSKVIRVVMSPQVEKKMTPGLALPFGFRGPELLNTNTFLTDAPGAGGVSGSFVRLAGSGSIDGRLLSAIVPPIPYRFKVTRGEISQSVTFEGYPGPNEVVDNRYFWGIKTERNVNVLNSNVSNEQNTLISSLTKFQGISKLDVLVTGSKTDNFNDNKFTLAKVCLSNVTLADVTGSTETHMREAAYIRNGAVNPSDYTISDTNGTRVSFATLLMKSSTVSTFNKFAEYAKFTTVMFGGWDGVNILDKNASKLNDKASSTEALGGANGSFVSPGFSSNQNGSGKLNSTVFSYRTAVGIATDPFVSQHNLMAIPGIREPFITDEAGTKTRDHSVSMYIMDIPYYDFEGNRVFDGDLNKFVDSGITADRLEARAIDNDHVATYFPNIVITDSASNRKLTVPASVAALAALGYNDRVSFPWYAPAGFNRASLGFVSQTQVKINQPDRDRLTEVKINPIVKFPGEGYVIMAQNTLKQQKSSLSSMNVKRMILDVKMKVVEAGNKILWDQISSQTRSEIVKTYNGILSNVQVKAGLELFKVTCDDTNNTELDATENKINVKIAIKPTGSVEFIAIDFVITNSGVEFV